MLSRKLVMAILTICSALAYCADAIATEAGVARRNNVASLKRYRDGFHLELKQIHRIYGKVDVQITADGARLKGANTDYIFVCSAPAWDMVLFSDKRKLVARRPRSDWSKKGIRTALSIMDNSALHSWPRTLVATKNYHGLKASIYGFPYRYKNGYPAELKHGKFGEYILSEPKLARAEVESFLQALYDCPPADGIPLRLAKLSQGNSYGLGLKYNKTEDSVSILETVSTSWINKTVNISTAHTRNYKVVSESDIVVKHDDLSDAFQHLVDEK
jgi:hypothetical protein